MSASTGATPLTILDSYNKRGFEADYWFRELTAASDDQFRFVPFNHDPYLDVGVYIRAQLLDNLWFDRDPRLLRDVRRSSGPDGGDGGRRAVRRQLPSLPS